MNTVTIDGVSSDTVRLKFDKIPFLPAAKRRTNVYPIPGSGEDLTIKTEDYDDIQLALTAYLVSSTSIQDVYDWIRGGSRMIVSTQPGVYAVIKAVGEIAPSRVGWTAHEINIPLTLSPFKYRVDDIPVQIESSGDRLRTIGNIYSYPYWVLEGTSGDVTFTVNGVAVTITDAPSNIHIDTLLQTVRSFNDGVATNIMDKTSGNFWELVLVPGDDPQNLIEWSGTVGSVTVTKKERWV